MKNLFLAAAALSAFAAAPAMAETPARYVQGNIGAIVGGEFEFDTQTADYTNEFRQEADSGVFTSVTFGQSIAPKWTAEAEVFYVNADMDMSGFSSDGVLVGLSADVKPMARYADKFEISTYGVMANANYEVYRAGKNSAYVGAGLGFGHVDYKVKSNYDEGSTDDNGVMWQLKAGVTRELTEKTALDVSYRYMNTPKIGEMGEPADFHALTMGIRYNF